MESNYPLGILHFCLILPGYNLFLSFFSFIICLFVIIIILSTSYEYYLEVIKQKEEILDSSKTQKKDKETDILLKSVPSTSVYSTKENVTALQAVQGKKDVMKDQPKSDAVPNDQNQKLQSLQLFAVGNCEISVKFLIQWKILNFSAYFLYLIIDH